MRRTAMTGKVDRFAAALNRLHDRPPAAFNKYFRPGFREAMDAWYTTYCDQYPDATQEERKEAYARASKDISRQYPTHEELVDREKVRQWMEKDKALPFRSIPLDEEEDGEDEY
jgi:hypothetical protein